MNVVIGSVGLLLNPRALKSVNSIEIIQPRMMCASFNGNPNTTIVFCYSLTNTSDGTDIIAFYNDLSFFIWHLPKLNVLILGGNMYAHIDKDGNIKFCSHNLPNRNGEYLTDFLLEIRPIYLYTKFTKKNGKRWTNTYPNNSYRQLDYISIKKKCTDSILNCK